MQWRCTDWLRSKHEGGGDRRYNNDGRVVLTGDDFEDESNVEVEIERFLSEDRIADWSDAAELVGLPLAEFVVVTLDRAAAAIQAASVPHSCPKRPKPPDVTMRVPTAAVAGNPHG